MLKKNLTVIFLITFLFIYSDTNIFANETRGLTITAKDNSSGQTKEIKLYNKSYAVIIGIDQYQNLPFDMQLSYAVRDAKGVEEVLKKNFKFDKIITLYNKEATKGRIMEVLLGDLSKEITEEDAVFVFWAGHGYTEKTSFGDLGYLLPFDGTLKPTELYKNFSMTMLKDDISKKIPAKHVFYVMDACYSGLLAKTRSIGRQSSRDYKYLQEITKEKVRQVLTAGDKDQTVLDGGPKGHSVFTGRFIEMLENTDDFITATEISTMLREKVFSDAQARNHTQTPKYGELFGTGDFVFIPSLEQRVEDTQSKIADLQKELEQLNATKEAALKAQDERAKRQAEIEKRAIEAKLKAEQLKQQALEDEKRKKEEEERERKRQERELIEKKKADEKRLASLKSDVEEKRKAMAGTTLSSLSPEATLTEMQEIDKKIKEIRESFRNELKNGINQIAARFNERYTKLANAKKDEFETEAEFQDKIAKEKFKIDKEWESETNELWKRIDKEYNIQINPFIDNLKKLSGNEFIITADNLILELGSYNAEANAFPVTIKTKESIKGIQVAANDKVTIRREEAREFKKHFENNILRPEIKGNFDTIESFRVSQAYTFDDATSKQYYLISSNKRFIIDDKQYELFTSGFLNLGLTIYDSTNNFFWNKDANPAGKEMTWEEANTYINNLNKTGYNGFKDWRLPSKEELESVVTYAKNAGYGGGGKTLSDFFFKEGFLNVQTLYYWSATTYGGNTGNAWSVDMRGGEIDNYAKTYNFSVWPVRFRQ